MSVRMRHTRGHSGNRRSHHGLTEPRLSTCKDCGSSYIRHHACSNCGRYKNRVVLDVAAKVLKKEEKRKAKQAELGGGEKKSETDGKEEEKEKSTDKSLDMSALSKK